MNVMAVVKRVLPFLATFAVGIFIASFFVTIAAPSFKSNGCRRKGEFRRLKVENEQLRNENLRLRNELDSKNFSLDELPRHPGHEHFQGLGPEFPVEIPLPPPPPAAPRRVR